MAAYKLSDARQWLKDNDFDNASARGQRNYDAIANDANAAFHEAGKFDFDRRWTNLVFQASYNTGTVSVVVGGTAVTGVGTTFPSTCAGSWIRFNGENDTYLIGAYVNATSITLASASGYQGASDLAAVSFEITNERVILPTRFRSFQAPILTTEGWTLVKAPSLGNLLQSRTLTPQTGSPTMYEVEPVEASGGTVPGFYIWVYPSPASKRQLIVPYSTWPAKLTAATDDFGFPDTAALERVLKLFLKAYLSEQQNNPKFTQQLQYAEQMAARAAGWSRDNTEAPQRKMWTAEDEQRMLANPLSVQWAPGEPRYTD